MFTVCSAQLVSTQPANKDKRDFTLFLQLGAALIILLATDTNGSRREEELLELG